MIASAGMPSEAAFLPAARSSPAHRSWSSRYAPAGVRNVVQPSSDSALLNCLRNDSGHPSQGAFYRAKLRRWCSVAPCSASLSGGRCGISLMLGETILRVSEIQRGHFGVACHFGNNRSCANFCDRLSPLTTAIEGMGNAGQRLPSIRTYSGEIFSPATARCIASIVACKIFSSSISCGSARPRLRASAFS